MKKDSQKKPSAKKTEDNGIDRRDALKKIVTTAAYVAPIATVMLTTKNQAKAGNVGSGGGFMPK